MIRLRKYNPETDLHYVVKTMANMWGKCPANKKKSMKEFQVQLANVLGNSNCLILCDKGDKDFIYGFTIYQKIEDFACILHGLYVRNTWRRLGLATKMVDTLVDRGYSEVVLSFELIDEDKFKPVLLDKFSKVHCGRRA